MATDDAYEDVVGFIDEQIERLYEDEDYLNEGATDKEEYTEDGERAKWTYFQEFTPSEQEAMEKDFTTLYDDLFHLTESKLDNLVSELAIIYVDPPSLDGDKEVEVKEPKKSKSKSKGPKSPTSPSNRFNLHDNKNEDSDEVAQIPVIVCREVKEKKEKKEKEKDGDEAVTVRPKEKCDNLLKELKDLRTSVLSDIGTLLDTKYTMYRRSLENNRTKNHTKLSEARTALKLFKKSYENESAANMKERDRLKFTELEEKYQHTISAQEIEIEQYQSSVNMKTQRNLGLNQELLDMKAENAILNGRIERLFEDLTNSYKRCEHVEKNERITKRKLFEATKKCTSLQKDINRLQRSKRGKLSRNNTMKSSSNIMTPQPSMNENDNIFDVDDADIDAFFEQQEAAPCTNCPILQEQLDNYKAKLKSLKSCDSFDRSSTFDRCDTGLSDISGIMPALSRADSRLDTPPEESKQVAMGRNIEEGIEEESLQNDKESVAQQSIDMSEAVSENFTEPNIIADNPHIPAFDEYSHNIMEAAKQEALVQPEQGTDENISTVTEMVHTIDGRDEESLTALETAREETESEVDVNSSNFEAYEQDKEERNNNKEEENKIEKNQTDELNEEDEDGEGVTFINNCEDVTSEVRELDEKDKEVFKIEKSDLNEVADDEVLKQPEPPAINEDKDESKNEKVTPATTPFVIPVTHSTSEVLSKRVESNDDASVTSHHTTTSIVADIASSLREVSRVDSGELFSLEMSAAEEEETIEIAQVKPRKKSIPPQSNHKTQKDQHQGHVQQLIEKKSKSEIASTRQPDVQPHKQSHRPSPVQVDEISPFNESYSIVDPRGADISARMSSILHSPASLRESREFSIQQPDQDSVKREDFIAMQKVLTETTEVQRGLEQEVSQLQKSKKEQDKYISELSGYIRTQDHIYNLKLKEREILLRELTQQTHDLRAQVMRDKKVFDEMKELADCNLPKIGIQKIKARKLASAGRKEEFPYFKLDLNSHNDVGSRPASSSGLQAFNAGLPDGPSALFRSRPISSPALNLDDTVHNVCGSSSPSRRSQFSSTGINSKKIEQSWQEDQVADKQLGINGVDDTTKTRYEVEEVRKKIALLMSHQEISLKRLRAKPVGAIK